MPINNPSGGTVTVGTTVFTGGTTGSVLFVGTSAVVQQDNANFFWDDTNNRFSLGNAGAGASGQAAFVSGDFLIIGATSGAVKNAIIFNNLGNGGPSTNNTSSVADKIVLWNDNNGYKATIGLGNNADIYFQSKGADSAKGFSFYSDTTEVVRITRPGLIGLGAVTAPTAFVHTAASTTTYASIRIPSGTAPSSPNSGDLWYDGTNLRFRDGATTRVITWT